MLRTIGWVLWLFAYMASRLPLYFRARRLQKQGRTAERDALIGPVVHRWAAKVLHHIKMEVRIDGLENIPKGRNVVFASNHQSYLDIPVLLACIQPPPPLLARREIGKVPLLKLYMEQLGCIFVQRNDARSAVAALKEAEELVKSGRSLVVFPEGTRSRGGPVAAFQPGMVRIAAKAGVPVVPVCIGGSAQGLEANGFKIQPAEVRLHFLPAIETAGLSKDEQKALAGTIQGQIAARLPGAAIEGGSIPAGAPTA